MTARGGIHTCLDKHFGPELHAKIIHDPLDGCEGKSRGSESEGIRRARRVRNDTTGNGADGSGRHSGLHERERKPDALCLIRAMVISAPTDYGDRQADVMRHYLESGAARVARAMTPRARVKSRLG